MWHRGRHPGFHWLSSGSSWNPPIMNSIPVFSDYSCFKLHQPSGLISSWGWTYPVPGPEGIILSGTVAMECEWCGIKRGAPKVPFCLSWRSNSFVFVCFPWEVVMKYLGRSLVAIAVGLHGLAFGATVTNDSSVVAGNTFDYIVAGAGLGGLTVGTKVCIS